MFEGDITDCNESVMPLSTRPEAQLTMGDKKRNKRKGARTPRKKKPRDGPVYFEHPFSQIPHEELVPHLLQYAKEAKGRFEEGIRSLSDTFRNHDPLQIVSTLAQYALTATRSRDDTITPLVKDERLTQAHVELAQALALAVPAASLSKMPPDPAVITKVMDLLPAVGDAFAHQRMVVMEQAKSDEQKAITLFQERLRLHTQGVRNWGYFDAVHRHVIELYRPLDDLFVARFGIPATGLIAVFHFLVRQVEERMTNRMKSLRQVLTRGTTPEIVRAYYEANPQFTESPEAMLAVAKRNRYSREQVRFLVLAHADLSLSRIFVFHPSDVARDLGLPEQSVAAIFEKMSLSFGHVSPDALERVMLDNPVWRRPLIRLGEHDFYCAMPQLFFSFVQPMLDELIGNDKELQHACESCRASFLEAQVRMLFEKSFPGGEFVSNYKWSDGDNRFENDLLVRVDSHLLIVEAKSGTVSWPALRGAPDRARKHIEELFIAPSIQSARFAERVSAVLKSPDRRQSLLPDLPMKLASVHTILRLSVTLHDFATSQSNLNLLPDTGWLPPGHTIAPCSMLTDLEVVFDILESRGQRLHYLRRRADLTNTMNAMGDELDFLGFYLDTGFNIGDAEFGELKLHLLGMSKPIDDYCMARAEKIKREKPKPRLTSWWADIISFAEHRGFHRWTDVVNILLSLSYNEQLDAERMFERIKRNVRTNWRRPSHECTVVIVPHPRKSNGVALYAYRDEDRENRRDRVQVVADQTFAHGHVQRCVVLAVNIDRKEYPYSGLYHFPTRVDSDDLVIC